MDCHSGLGLAVVWLNGCQCYCSSLGFLAGFGLVGLSVNKRRYVCVTAVCQTVGCHRNMCLSVTRLY